VLKRRREYSTSRYSESRRRAFSFPVESTRPSDIPRVRGERSRPPSSVLDAAIVIALTRISSVTGTLIRHRVANPNIQAATVRPAQRLPINAYRAPRPGAAAYPASGSRPPTSLGPSGPIVPSKYQHRDACIPDTKKTLPRIVTRNTRRTSSTQITVHTHASSQTLYTIL